MTNTRWLFLCLGLLAASCAKKTPLASPLAAEQNKKSTKKVLVLHSYHPEYEWVAGVNRGIRMELVPSEAQLEFFYMDTKRHPNLPWMEQKGQEALTLIEEWQPDVVITCDDDAQRHVGSKLAGKDKPAIVFCGVNGKPQDYGYPASNVTGVLERLHFNETLALAKQILPDAKTAFLITDYSATSQGVIDYIQTLPSGALKLEGWAMPQTFSQWQYTVEEWSKKVDVIAVYVYHTVKPNQESENSMPPTEVMRWTVDNCSVPVIGFLTFSIDDGSLCGVLESAVEQGQIAAEMTRQILQGKRPADIPFTTATQGQTMLNLKAAKRWKIDIPQSFLQQVNVVAE